MTTKGFNTEDFTSNLRTLTRCASLITDLNRKIIFATHTTEDVFGYAPKELIGQPIDIVMLKEDLTYFVPNIYKITLERGSFQGEVALRARSGESFYGQLATYLIAGNGTEPKTVLLSIHNVSMIKQVEKDYVYLKKLTSLGMITDMIAHHMRTPLLSLSGFAERLERFLPPDDSALRPYLPVFKKEIDSLEAIVTQLEELARLPQPDYKKYDLVELLQEVLEQIHVPAVEDKAPIQFDISLTTQDQTLYTDRDLLQRAMKILLEMAADISPQDQQVIVRLSGDEDVYLIEVCGTATRDDVSRISDVLDTAFTLHPQHSTIRLMTARRIIEDQGGRLEDLGTRGEGLCFRIRLPRERRRKIRTQPL